MSVTDLLRPVVIPDVAPAALLGLDKGNQPDFSMCAGEFLEAYANDKGACVCLIISGVGLLRRVTADRLYGCFVIATECWDCIVTCFFIDAAPNVIQYIEAFERMLKPGGYWINLGPLLYHWQSVGGSGEDDERFDQSIELSYDEIKHVMGTYNFKILVCSCFHGLIGGVCEEELMCFV